VFVSNIGLLASYRQNPHLLAQGHSDSHHSWEIWKERNERVFSNKSSLPSVIMHKIREEGKDWVLAGANGLRELLG
jgi:hypothetical protein